ncbi:hypothetical protein [Metabacillus halosaccharovorans]|uniref:hypothetical protein n=1 Tax=Metabacillus halosaccharovorans TaxID=930124 RepID=UPI001C200839|nr:hypothetical protein [Metabacillus halosaccharovorans]MBU7594171.1 hypothetical protein [Metabacillus halosaccharovorans]
MKNIIYFMFGKPYIESKFYRLTYWFGVGFYFFAMLLFSIQALSFGGLVYILFPAITFPLIFRLVYKLNTRIHRHTSFKGLNKRVFIILGIVLGGMIGLFTVITLVVTFFLGDNVVINMNKTTTNGEVNVSIDSLKGNHEVETFEINETVNGTMTIPFEASVEEGEYTIYVEHSDEKIWEDTISSEKNGVIRFKGKKGIYTISVYTDEAKKVKLSLSLY